MPVRLINYLMFFSVFAQHKTTLITSKLAITQSQLAVDEYMHHPGCNFPRLEVSATFRK